MVCEKCMRNIETREFDGKNLCYDCAFKKFDDGEFKGLLSPDEYNVKRKFSRTQEEIEEEEFYKKNIKDILKQFDNILKKGEVDSYVNAIEKFLNSDMLRVLHDEGDDNVHDFFLNDFRHRISDLLNKGKIEHAEKLAYLYIKFGKEYYIPVPGLMYEPIIEVETIKRNYNNVFEFLILVVKDQIDRIDELSEKDDIYEKLSEMKKLMNAIIDYNNKLKNETLRLERDNKNLPIYEEHIKRIFSSISTKREGKLIAPNTPYGNVANLIKTINECTGFIDWFDPYFARNGFDALYEAENDSIKRIRILSGTEQTTERLKNNFLRFKEELNKKSINIEFRILIDESTKETHDRWMISSNKRFNLPSLNTIYRGQWSEIKETTNEFPFEKYWSMGKDLISDWNLILKYLQNKSNSK